MQRLAIGSMLLLAPVLALPATWVDTQVTCPVCGTVNVFKAIASYGTYVYREPSRFQYVFWPATTDNFLYLCKQCHLTTYMQDFENVPPEKVDELSAMLEREAGIEGDVVPYYDVAVSIRLGIAEKVYEILGRDAAFWGEFRRVEGFHLARAEMRTPAREARLEALRLAERMLENGDAGIRKETLVIAAAMRLHTGDAAGARAALEEAETLRVRTESLGEESSAGLDGFLDELIRAFREEHPATRPR